MVLAKECVLLMQNLNSEMYVVGDGEEVGKVDTREVGVQVDNLHKSHVELWDIKSIPT